DAEGRQALGDGRAAGRAGGVLDGEGEEGAGRDAGVQLVADLAGELEDRATLGRGAQVALVGDPLLVERHDVGDGRPGVEQRDRGVVRGPVRQGGERARTGRVVWRYRLGRQAREHALQERGVDAAA